MRTSYDASRVANVLNRTGRMSDHLNNRIRQAAMAVNMGPGIQGSRHMSGPIAELGPRRRLLAGCYFLVPAATKSSLSLVMNCVPVIDLFVKNSWAVPTKYVSAMPVGQY